MTSILCSEFYGHDCLQTCRDVKIASSKAYLLKLGENLSWDFEVVYIFRKNAVLDICLYLKGFYVYKKTNNIFLKFYYYLFGMPKIIEIG